MNPEPIARSRPRAYRAEGHQNIPELFARFLGKLDGNVRVSEWLHSLRSGTLGQQSPGADGDRIEEEFHGEPRTPRLHAIFHTDL